MPSKDYDWKNHPSHWPYNGDVDDPLYLYDRAVFFAGFEGWWIQPSNKTADNQKSSVRESRIT